MNVPVATAKIQFRTSSLDDTAKPTYRPRNAVRAENKFSKAAFLNDSPDWINTAKSPGKEKKYNL